MDQNYFLGIIQKLFDRKKPRKGTGKKLDTVDTVTKLREIVELFSKTSPEDVLPFGIDSRTAVVTLILEFLISTCYINDDRNQYLAVQ